MNRERLEQLLEEARAAFLRHESYLLSADANERSLTHKFAEYLQPLVGPEWSVDCEYNRYGFDSKTLEGLQEIVGKYVATDATKSRTVYPDIIIHKRGPRGPNLLVIEAKKDASAAEREEDWRKLEAIREQYAYSFAAFIDFLTEDEDLRLEIRE